MKYDDLYSIIAPVCSVEQAEELFNCGANELYFGFMEPSWVERYGNSDMISRRQSEYSHINSKNDLKKLIEIGKSKQGTLTLVLNSKYSEIQLPYIKEIIKYWAEIGGNSVMLSDINLILWIRKEQITIDIHLSVLTGVFNSNSVEFFRQLGIKRIVIPREMHINEMNLLVDHSDFCEFEVIVLFQKCFFIDSFCNFYHNIDYCSYPIVDLNEESQIEVKSELECLDYYYSGHGCKMGIIRENGLELIDSKKNDLFTPDCAACQLKRFFECGINRFKIAGRGYPFEIIKEGVKFMREVINSLPTEDVIIQKIYKKHFGNNCRKKYCYYQ